MRVSIDSEDIGYNPAVWGSKVFFEGSEIGYCITADEDRRLVVVYRLDDLGKPMLTPDRQSVERETRYGNVRIELSPAMNRLLQGRQPNCGENAMDVSHG